MVAGVEAVEQHLAAKDSQHRRIEAGACRIGSGHRKFGGAVRSTVCHPQTIAAARVGTIEQDLVAQQRETEWIEAVRGRARNRYFRSAAGGAARCPQSILSAGVGAREKYER